MTKAVSSCTSACLCFSCALCKINTRLFVTALCVVLADNTGCLFVPIIDPDQNKSGWRLRRRDPQGIEETTSVIPRRRVGSQRRKGATVSFMSSSRHPAACLGVSYLWGRDAEDFGDLAVQLPDVGEPVDPACGTPVSQLGVEDEPRSRVIRRPGGWWRGRR